MLGLDVGQKRIGVSISDPLGITAQRLTVIQKHSAKQDLQAVAALAKKHQARALVIGLPLRMDGQVGTAAQEVMGFVGMLRKRLCLPVHTVDERLTTVQGERALLSTDTSRRKRKLLADQVAAQLILQAYLDAKS